MYKLTQKRKHGVIEDSLFYQQAGKLIEKVKLSAELTTEEAALHNEINTAGAKLANTEKSNEIMGLLSNKMK